MEILGYIFLGFAPGVFWLLYFRRKDDLEPEPHGRLLAVFGLGCASAFALLGVDALLPPIEGEPGLRRDAIVVFVRVALVEEALKLLAFYLGAFRSRELDEPLDGIVYGIAAGLGFASVENVRYLLITGDPSLLVLRAFTATLGHAAFTGIAGFLIGLSRFRPGRIRPLLLLGGPLAAVLLHGLYDLFLLPEMNSHLALLGLLPASLVFLSLKIRWSRARSAQYHPDRVDPEG